jgi:hypothetical protein
MYLAGDDEEVLRVRVTVERNKDAGRDHAPQHAEVIR